MFKHEKMLFHPVEVESPNPQYAVLLQEQLGGGNGELKAAMQYMSQSFRVKDPATIGHQVVFSLWGWSPNIHTRFHVSRTTLDTASLTCLSHTRLSLSMVYFSK